MKSRAFLAVALAAALGTGGLTAAGPPRPARPGEHQGASKLPPGTTDWTLARLDDRCEQMLERQSAVRDGARRLHQVIQGRPGKKPTPADRRSALELAAGQERLIAEATKAIESLEKEGAAEAFSEVFQVILKDMRRLRLRLKGGDVGPEAQAIGQDVIDTLREMILSLRKV
jgi:hypothetical protein